MKKKRVRFIFFSMIFSAIFATNLCAYEPPLTLFGLLRGVHSATLFSFHIPNYGMLFCPLYGVMHPANTTQNAPCQLDPERVREMRYHARNFTLRWLFLEQKYRLGFVRGWCFLQDGAHLFNAILIREGYGVMRDLNLDGINAEELKNELRTLEEIAKHDKKGLWKDWSYEMRCLSSIAKSMK